MFTSKGNAYKAPVFIHTKINIILTCPFSTSYGSAMSVFLVLHDLVKKYPRSQNYHYVTAEFSPMQESEKGVKLFGAYYLSY